MNTVTSFLSTDTLASQPASSQRDAFAVGLSAPLSVCWDITSRCNDDCAFCFRVLGQHDLTLRQHRAILAKLIQARVRKVSFIGGEPLLVRHLPTLLEEAHGAGLVTSVVTNGILLEQRWRDLVASVDWITLPIDGSNEQIQTQMTRRGEHLTLVRTLVKMLKETKTKVKINTVVGCHNISDLSHIAQLVNELDVQRWKVFQFVPIRGYAAQNAQQFAVADQEFLNAVNNAVKYIRNPDRCLVTVADRDYLRNNYFSIMPDGRVKVTVNLHDEVLGSLLQLDVMDIWQSPHFDHGKHARFRLWLAGQP